IGVLVYFIGRKLNLIDKIEGFQWSWSTFLNAILILLIIFAVEGLLHYILSMLKPKSNRLRTLISLTKNLLRYAAILVAICVVLRIFTVDVGTILAGLGIIALIIGFGAESLIADIVTGFFILVDDQYNVGDIIEVNGFRGAVTEINVRSTVLTDVGGNVKIINNSDMKNILNRSNQASKSVSEFPIPYETNLEELETHIPELLEEIYQNNTDLMQTVPEYLGVDKLDDSAVVLRFIVDVAEADIYAGSRALNRGLFIGMRKLGIEVPFPQLDLHQK
ncbi:MAG: mechanosensitive ion channel family protein, partial [Clostridia bacterium]|nr:mechanosensitive ion channel family protein [Clostridia bacterium]